MHPTLRDRPLISKNRHSLPLQGAPEASVSRCCLALPKPTRMGTKLGLECHIKAISQQRPSNQLTWEPRRQMVLITKLEAPKHINAMDKPHLVYSQRMPCAGSSSALLHICRRATTSPLQSQKYRQLLIMRGPQLEPQKILNHSLSRKNSIVTILETHLDNPKLLIALTTKSMSSRRLHHQAKSTLSRRFTRTKMFWMTLYSQSWIRITSVKNWQRIVNKLLILMVHQKYLLL